MHIGIFMFFTVTIIYSTGTIDTLLWLPKFKTWRYLQIWDYKGTWGWRTGQSLHQGNFREREGEGKTELKQYLTNILQTYVQDLIKKNKKEIYDMLVNKNGHFYVCGDVSMAEDVHTSLEVGSVKHIEYNRSSLFWCKHNTKHF